MNNIEELIKQISQQTDLSRAEIKMKIEQKKEELGFFVNDIAAAHIIAKDLNISLGRPDLKKKSQITIKDIKKMEPGLSGISITGIIYRVYNPIEFVRMENKGILAPILLHDGTDYIRTVLWGKIAGKIINKNVERGSIVKIKQGYTKKSRNEGIELHLGDRGTLELVTDIRSTEFPDPENEILSLDSLDEEIQEVDVKATVHKVGNIVTFNRADGSEGRVSNLFLITKHDIKRMVFWDEQAEIPFNFTRGDEILIQATNVKLGQDGKLELQATRATYITKIGYQNLPNLDEKKTDEYTKNDIPVKKLAKISPNDNMVGVIARKGPVDELKKFKKKDGSIGSLKKAIIFDETGETILVIWDELISEFDSLEDNTFQINKLRVNLSIYNTLELHTVTGTNFIRLDSSEIPEDPLIQNIKEINANKGIVSVQGIIQNVSETREFSRTNGAIGRVASMNIQDNTGICRVVAWDNNVDKLLSIKEKEMKYVKVFFGRVRKNNDGSIEIHLSSQTHVRPSSRIPVSLRSIEISKNEEEKIIISKQTDYQKIQLSELAEDEDGSLIEVLGKIIRIFQQTPYYWACKSCRKKVEETENGWECQNHGLVDKIINMRISGLIDDGTGTIRITLFGRSVEILTGMNNKEVKKFIDSNLTDDEIFSLVKKEAEGKTIIVQGIVKVQTRDIRGETMLNQTLFVNRVKSPYPKALSEELITELQES